MKNLTIKEKQKVLHTIQIASRKFLGSLDFINEKDYPTGYILNFEKIIYEYEESAFLREILNQYIFEESKKDDWNEYLFIITKDKYENFKNKLTEEFEISIPYGMYKDLERNKNRNIPGTYNQSDKTMTIKSCIGDLAAFSEPTRFIYNCDWDLLIDTFNLLR